MQLGHFMGQTDHFLPVCGATIPIDHAVHLRDGESLQIVGLCLQLPLGIDAAVIEEGAVIGIVRVIVFPEPRIHFQDHAESRKVDIMLLFLHFLPAGSAVENLDAKLETCFGRLFLENGHHVLEALVTGGQGERQLLARIVEQNAIGAAAIEARLGEVLQRKVDVILPGLQGRVCKLAKTVVSRIETPVIPAEKFIDHQLPVGRVLDAQAYIAIIEARPRAMAARVARRDFRGIDPQAIGRSRSLVVKDGLVNVPGLHVGIAVGEFLIPVFRQVQGRLVEIPAPERLEDLLRIPYHGKLDPVRIETIAPVFLVLRPPVGIPGQGNGAPFPDILGLNHVGAGRRRKTPLVTVHEVVTQFPEEMAGLRAQFQDPLLHIRLALGDADGNSVSVVARDIREHRAVIVVVPGGSYVGRTVEPEAEQVVVGRNGCPIGIPGSGIELHINRFPVFTNGPGLGETRDIIEIIPVPVGQLQGGIIQQQRAESAVGIGADGAQRSRKIL